MFVKFNALVLLPFLMFIGFPLMAFTLGVFPERGFVKEGISLAVFLALFLAIGQFYWSGDNTLIKKKIRLKQIRKTHEMLGYACVFILTLHPLLLLVPRLMSPGLDPVDAFMTILTTTSNRGLVVGMTAWFILMAIGIISLLRSKLPWGYRTWKQFHGCLAALFVVAAAWHAVELGRHVNTVMSILLLTLAGSGVGSWLVDVCYSKFRNGGRL